MENAFYFILKALFILRYLNFCLDFFGQVGKRHDWKIKVSLKIYEVITCSKNNYNRHIAQYLKK